LLVSSHRYLDISLFEKIQGYKKKNFEQQQTGSKASDPWPYWSYVLSLSSSHIELHALILLPKPHTFRIWVFMLGLLCLAVQSWESYKSFHPLWCWVWLVSLWECCGLPSVEMRDDRVRIDDVVWETVGMVEMVNTDMACGARIY
jgi:hypothetical protein